jgi:hypothetical protein
MGEWLRTFWSLIRENREGITLVSAILGGIAAVFGILTYLSRVRSGRRAPQAQALAEAEPLLPQWPSDLIARSVAVRVLRNGFPVAPRTRLIVIDRGVRQFSREPGKCSASAARQVLEKHSISKGAHALQYITVPVEVEIIVPSGKSQDGFTDIETRISVQVKVDDAAAERLIDWHISLGGKVQESQVRDTLASAIAPWLLSQIGAYDFEKLTDVFQALRPKAQEVLQSELSNHGLLVTVRGFRFRSTDHEAGRRRSDSEYKDWLAAEEERLKQRREGGRA